jgi:hypothetical protein
MVGGHSAANRGYAWDRMDLVQNRQQQTPNAAILLGRFKGRHLCVITLVRQFTDGCLRKYQVPQTPQSLSTASQLEPCPAGLLLLSFATTIQWFVLLCSFLYAVPGENVVYNCGSMKRHSVSS